MTGNINTETIPDALTDYDQWVCWQYDHRDADKPAKKPLIPHNREAASVSDPETWMSFDAADMAGTAKNVNETEGIGFVFTDDDPFVGIDLDDCRENGELTDWAKTLIQDMDSYTEVSPSGTGVHIILRGDLPDGGKRDGNVEVYDSKRFFTVTGRHLDGTPATVEDRQNEVKNLRPELVNTNSNEQRHPESDTRQSDEPDTQASTAGSEAGQQTTGDTADHTTLQQAREVVTEEFGARTWDATEAALAAHATLMLDVNQCTGMVLVGNSGSGKTTVLRFFDGHDHVLRSDDATPASFVSADASMDEQELRDIDLLPRIKNKTLLCRDMATWFSGDQDTIRNKMSTLAHLMDGEGYERDTGSQGRRGYSDGDYRFSFLGASTPLSPRAWSVMGHTGNRFVFHEKRGNATTEEVVDDVLTGSNYGEQVARCRTVVQALYDTYWEMHGGYRSVSLNDEPSDEIRGVHEFLTNVVTRGRAPIEEGAPCIEGGHRVATTLRDLAYARALLDGRTTLQIEDLQVPTRVALSTIPKKHRPVIQAVLNPDTSDTLSTTDITDVADVSKPTAQDRMKTLDTLGFVDCTVKEDDGRKPQVIETRPKFKWPDALTFPTF